MLDKNIKKELLEELEVPQMVKERVKFTLDDIRLEEFGKRKEKSIEKEKGKRNKKKGKQLFGKGAVAAACVLLVSSITVTAAVSKWTPDFMQRFLIPEELKEKMEEEGVNYTPLETIEHEGMSVSLEQCMTDNEYFYCLFKVILPEGVENGEFENVMTEGYKPEDSVESYGTHCYEVTEEDSENNIFYYTISGRHSTLITQDEGENAEKTTKILDKSCVTEEDYKTGHMTFRFENFGVYDKNNEFQPLVKGIWEFQWAEKEIEDKKEYSINRKVGKGYYERSNAILKTVTVSPIVINLTYELPDCPEDKESFMYYPATPTEVELTDGTKVELTEIYSGFEDYSDKENKNLKYAYALYPVRDTEEIVAVYFGKNERVELE